MKRTARIVAAFLIALMLASTVSGCSQKEGTPLSDNEVLSLLPYDTSKTSIVISVCDNIRWEHLSATLEQALPEYNIILRHGLSTNNKLAGRWGDVYLVAEPDINPEYEKNLLDLSTFESTNRYYAASLQGCASTNDGRQYLIPGPVNIRGIIYNKTMFEENGWQIPHCKTEFIRLCQTIQASGVVERAFQPSLHYGGDVLAFAQQFNEANFFATIDYYAWRDDYASSGDISIEPVLKMLLDTYNELLRSDVIQVSDFTMKPSSRSTMMYTDRTAAMTIETQLAAEYAPAWGSADEFGMLPFYSGDGPEDDYVISTPLAFIAVDASVARAGNGKKLEAVTKLLDYIATTEGQRAFIPEGATAISQLKGGELDFAGSAILEGVQGTMNAGRMVPVQPIFKRSLVWSKDAINAVMNALYHTKKQDNQVAPADRAATFQEAVAYLDDYSATIRENPRPILEEVYATAARGFTQLETAQYFAQMFKNKTGADIALCRNNGLSISNDMMIPAGELTRTGGVGGSDVLTHLDLLLRISAVDGEPCRLTLYQMTGRQILAALENFQPGGESPALFEAFFVPAGLKVEFAPWAAPGERYLKVKLPDGSGLVPDRLYTVAAFSHTIADAHITGTLRVYEDSFKELLKEQLLADKELTPFDDGRFKLNWKVNARQPAK